MLRRAHHVFNAAFIDSRVRVHSFIEFLCLAFDAGGLNLFLCLRSAGVLLLDYLFSDKGGQSCGERHGDRITDAREIAIIASPDGGAHQLDAVLVHQSDQFTFFAEDNLRVSLHQSFCFDSCLVFFEQRSHRRHVLILRWWWRYRWRWFKSGKSVIFAG